MSDQRSRSSAPADTGIVGCPQGSSVRVDPAHWRITVHGEFDLAAAPMLIEATTTLIDRSPRDCTIDIAGVRFMDARGLGCLVHVANQLAANGANLRVVGASPWLRRVFNVTKLDRLLFPRFPARGPPRTRPTGT